MLYVSWKWSEALTNKQIEFYTFLGSEALANQQIGSMKVQSLYTTWKLNGLGH